MRARIKAFISGTLLCVTGSMYAQTPVIESFTDSRAGRAIFGIDHNQRLDMADYFQAGLTTPTEVLGDLTATITGLSDDHATLSWAIANNMDYSLSIINKGKKAYLLVIETMSAPERDSRLSWYDLKWQDAKAPVDMPVLDDWLTPEGLKNRAFITAWLPFMTATAHKVDGANELIFTHTLHQRFIAADDAKRVDAWFKPSITVRL